MSINQQMINERDAEDLMIAAFNNINEHFLSVAVQLTAAAEKEKNETTKAIYLARAEALVDIAVPIMKSASEMIAAPAGEEDKVGLILPSYLK